MQRRIVKSLKDRKIHLIVAGDIAVSVGADITGTEAKYGCAAAQPADIAVAVSGHGDGADMSAASRGSDPDGSFRAVSEQIVGNQRSVSRPRK